MIYKMQEPEPQQQQALALQQHQVIATTLLQWQQVIAPTLP